MGSIPPPYGGVSIHIQRLKELLQGNGISCVVYDFSNFMYGFNLSEKHDTSVLKMKNPVNWIKLFVSDERITHLHISGISVKNIMSIIIMGLRAKLMNKKLIVTYHSFRNDLDHYSWIRLWVIQNVLLLPNHHIAVSQSIADILQLLKVNPCIISTIPAFLPPSINQDEVNAVNTSIHYFIKKHHPIIAANANRITFYRGQDLYGLDMCIDLCACLRGKYDQIGLIFFLSKILDQNYFDKLNERLIEYDIKDNFLFVTEPFQFYPLLLNCDIFVRPTNTDGDAISIREALYFKVPTVASNVVQRPVGTISFNNRDMNDFVKCVENVLENYDMYKDKLNNIVESNYGLDIIGLYEKYS